MARLFHKDEIPEVFVYGDQNAVFSHSPFQKQSISWIGTPLARLDDIMAHLSQPLGQTSAGAPIDEKFHLLVI